MYIVHAASSCSFGCFRESLFESISAQTAKLLAPTLRHVRVFFQPSVKYVSYSGTWIRLLGNFCQLGIFTPHSPTNSSSFTIRPAKSMQLANYGRPTINKQLSPLSFPTCLTVYSLQSINQNPWRPGVVGVPRQIPFCFPSAANRTDVFILGHVRVAVSPQLFKRFWKRLYSFRNCVFTCWNNLPEEVKLASSVKAY